MYCLLLFETGKCRENLGDGNQLIVFSLFLMLKFDSVFEQFSGRILLPTFHYITVSCTSHFSITFSIYIHKSLKYKNVLHSHNSITYLNNLHLLAVTQLNLLYKSYLKLLIKS